MAVAIGPIKDPANVKSVPINIFIRNAGKNPISKEISFANDTDYWMLYTIDDHGHEIKLNHRLQKLDDLGPGITLYIPPGETWRFHINLSMRLILEIKRDLLAEIEFRVWNTKASIIVASERMDASPLISLWPKPPSASPPPTKAPSN